MIHTLHIFSQIMVICFKEKTGRSPFEILFITFLGELGPGSTTDDDATAEVDGCCIDGEARSESAIIGSGDPGLAGGDRPGFWYGSVASWRLLRSLFNSSRR